MADYKKYNSCRIVFEVAKSMKILLLLISIQGPNEYSIEYIVYTHNYKNRP